jgi:putative flippase GtrA
MSILKVRIVKKSYTEVFRFGLVGDFNTIHHQLWYILMINLVHYTIANSIGFIMSYMGSFFLNTYFTYRSRPSLKKFLLFPITYLLMLLLSTFGFFMLIEYIGIDIRLASFYTSIAAVPFSIIIYKYIPTNE